MKKILLLTDIPPCKNLTAGLVLDQLCRLLPEGSVVCYSVVNPALNAKISPDLGDVPIEYVRKPKENGGRLLPGKFGVFSSLALEAYNALFPVRSIAARAIAFGRENRVDAVWAVLQGQTMIRLALPVANGLGIPLLTQVWDPPYWWLRENKVDFVSGKLVLKDFENTLRKSSSFAAASWAMAEEYHNRFGTRSVPVIPSLDVSLALPPAKTIHDGDNLIIGLAGQIYSHAEWEALIAALDSVDWEICRRRVTIRLLGRYANLASSGKMRIEFLGWRSQPETIELMAEADILYCPYWFDPVFANEARLSFPSKLTTYLAAGRPVLFHGPDYASPGRFIVENDAGICCNSLEKGAILECITRLLSEDGLYARLAWNGSTAFKKHLTLTSMKENFLRFLGI